MWSGSNGLKARNSSIMAGSIRCGSLYFGPPSTTRWPTAALWSAAGTDRENVSSSLTPFTRRTASGRPICSIPPPRIRRSESPASNSANLMLDDPPLIVRIWGLVGFIDRSWFNLPEPTTPKPSAAKPPDKIGTFPHETPGQAGVVILDHQDDWSLVETIMEWGYPQVRPVGAVGKRGVEGGIEAIRILRAQFHRLEVLQRR